ncbi:MAG: hypothetical protein QOC65_633 [Sphingomonadales bacterium]|nr:hypothetical protein [Sphingomonadales bacterium]
MLGIAWLALVPLLLAAAWLALTRHGGGAFDYPALTLAASIGSGGLLPLRLRPSHTAGLALLYLAIMALVLPGFSLLFVCGAFGTCL